MGSNGPDSTDRLQQGSGPGRRAWLRWLPAVAAPAVIAAGVLAGSIPARAGDPLPAKTPAQVLELLGTHQVRSFSGTVEQSSELGLPELPAAGKTAGPAATGGAASVIELLSGDHTARVYVDGKDNARLQMVDQLAERDVVHHGNDVWFYSSKDNSAAHLTLPAHTADHARPDGGRDMPAMPTPGDLAQQFLAKVEPTTSVTVGPDVAVAGRAAYNLVLEPRTDATLVGRVAIAVDGRNGMPLSVQVTARGADQPAFRTGFSSLSLEAPDPSLFTFAPPPGSSVKEIQVPDKQHLPASVHEPGMAITPEQLLAQMTAKGHVVVTGKGWDTVVGLPAQASSGSPAEALLQDPLLSQAAVVVPGGHLLSTALLNVLITDDGRIFAGMVPPERLQAAAAAAQ
ncbi:LolA family protein [Arthrobacter sp. C152]